MPVTPLFFDDVDALKTELRLSGSTQTDTAAIIERAIKEVRVGFYDNLGTERMAQLLALTVEDSPTSSEGILALKAQNAEVLWTRLKLFQVLPTLFMDSSGNTAQIWNEEGVLRDSTPSEINRQIKRMETDLLTMLEDLDGSSSEGISHVSCIGPTETPKKPGQSVFPNGV